MPPQMKFTRDVILQQAFEIVRKEGLEALSTRRIAQELECSTRPVYNASPSMQELQEATIVRAWEYALSYFTLEIDAAEPFLSFGLRYFHFAQEEPQLFKLLFLDGRIGIDLEAPGRPFSALLAKLSGDPYLQGLPEDSLKRIGTDMWIYVHGLTTLAYRMHLENADEFIRERLLLMGQTIVEWERGSS
jgi:AcrR family transcriptional regulator